MSMSPEDRIIHARLALDGRGLTTAHLLHADIRESWERCLAAGLDPAAPPAPAVADAATLNAARERHEVLRRLALAEMQNLYQQIAGTNYMIAFAEPGGMLLDTVADSSFVETARATAIRPGGLWAERRCGTNALGTVALTAKPITVHRGEHFFASFGGLTCTAAPVTAPDGTLAGVLDASSDCRHRQRHTKALVQMAATQIENGLFRLCHGQDLIVAFHSRGEYLRTLSAGLLALDGDGRVLAANAQARFLLHGLSVASGRPFEEVFRTPFPSFIEDARRQERQRLEDRVGSVFIASVENLRQIPAMQVPVVQSRGLHRGNAPGFVAGDPKVGEAVRVVEAAARRALPILIRGDTGTGKEQMARFAHQASRRRGAFVPVNCAALPESLAEAELFGHGDGAFTGARKGGAPGLAVEADGGTLFLDEIGDMPTALQSLLLRLLDDWTVRPVGGGPRRRVDVLLVAATNADLDTAIAAGRFRADLFFRLNTIEVTLPPLAQRRDFAAIARRLLVGLDPDATITDAALAQLATRAWPGNIRELRSVLTRLWLAAPGGHIDAPPVDAAAPTAPVSSLRNAVHAQVLAALDEADGNISEAARRLGVSRNTVYRAVALERGSSRG